MDFADTRAHDLMLLRLGSGAGSKLGRGSRIATIKPLVCFTTVCSRCVQSRCRDYIRKSKYVVFAKGTF